MSGKAYERFNIHHRIQHIMMFVSFFICTFTGIAIKYDQSSYARAFTKLLGGFENLLAVHLVGAAIMLIGSCLYHLLYLIAYVIITRKISFEALPTLKDFKDLYQNLKYFLGLSPEKPKFTRFSYKEKFDYWAVFWGIFIIGGSGLMMWFPDIAAKFVPRYIIDASRAAHSDEAILAIVVIFTWHFFNVHFNPDFFPGSLVWFHGKLTEEQMLEEHPLELQKLKEAKGGEG